MITLRRKRLAAALIIGIALLASRAEVVFPEVHDGDASSQVGPHGDAPSTETSVVSEGAGTESGTPAQPHGPAHGGLHIDHCGHGHGVACTDAAAPSMEPRHGTVLDARSFGLVSIVMSLPVRPPIL